MTEGNFLGRTLLSSPLFFIAIQASVKKKHPSTFIGMSSLANAGLARYAVSIIHPASELTLTKHQCDYCKQKKFRYMK